MAVVVLFAMTTEFPADRYVAIGNREAKESNVLLTEKTPASKMMAEKSKTKPDKVPTPAVNKKNTNKSVQEKTIVHTKVVPEKPKEKAVPPAEDPKKKAYDESMDLAYTNLGKEGYRIMANGTKSVEQLADFLTYFNEHIDVTQAYLMAGYYISESEKEGVNHDIAFCQMCLETGFLKFGGIVEPKQNNFCGLGAVNANTPGEHFPTRRMGVIAHIQHLKAYASKKPLNGQLLDRRFKWVKRGCAPTVDGLAGKWAADREYSLKIKSLLYRLDLSTKNYLSNR